MMKREIKLIKNVYRYHGDLYEDLDSCLSEVMSDELHKVVSAHRFKINDINDLIRVITTDDDFKKRVDEVLNVHDYEVTE